MEHNGIFFACDHFVDPDLIIEIPLETLFSSFQRGFGRENIKAKEIR